jgi:hypothetical protein
MFHSHSQVQSALMPSVFIKLVGQFHFKEQTYRAEVISTTDFQLHNPPRGVDTYLTKLKLYLF